MSPLDSLSRRHFLTAAGAVAAVALTASPAAATSTPRVPGDQHGLPGGGDLLALTATQVVAAIAAGHLDAETYTRVLLERAESLSDLRAVITLDRDGALAAARAVDEARRCGEALGPVAGLPLLVKDNINTSTLPTSGGTAGLEGFVPSFDAVVLQALLAGGAIVLGKANMHELAFGATTTNFTPFAGFGQNPYDRTRIPGGSSGGTGAGIAARIAPAGLGTDTGGSVRVPSAYNGIAGLRPSTGNGGAERRYSTKGVIPLSSTLDTPGPMGRTVADVALLDAVITDTCVPQAADLTGVRLGVPAVLWADVDEQVAAVTRAAVDKIAAAGATIVEVDVPDLLAASDRVGFAIALHEPITLIPKYLQDSGAEGITLASLAEEVASPDVEPAFAAVLSDAEGANYPDAINVYRPALQQLVADYFAANDLDAMVFPTSPVPPAPIDPVNGSGTTSINGGPSVPTFNTTIRNMVPGATAGIPGLSLPAGMSERGLPVGLSIEGPLGSDKHVLAIGLSVEGLLGTVPAPSL